MLCNPDSDEMHLVQFCAKNLVIFQLTISILGVFWRHCIPLVTKPTTATGGPQVGKMAT